VNHVALQNQTVNPSTSSASVENPAPLGVISPGCVVQGFKRICVVGLGYVGLPTALMFSRAGYQVFGADIRQEIVEHIEQGTICQLYPELTPWWLGLQDSEGTFEAGLSPQQADVFIITVPTPLLPKQKTCDLSMVMAAVDAIIPCLEPYNLVILESTVPPGTTQKWVQKAIEEKTGLIAGETFFLCFSPERVLPGNTIQELLENDRLMGGVTETCGTVGKILLEGVLQGRVQQTTATTAEFCKLAENTYRDVNIALANELSLLADDYQIDIHQARSLINLHPRVNLLKPGIGVGGHCIAVDPWFLVEEAPQKTPLIQAARGVNDSMPRWIAHSIMADLQAIDSPRICLAGMTYKPDIADIRESPAIEVYECLKQYGYTVDAYDPLVPQYQTADFWHWLQGADYLGVLVQHGVLNTLLSENRDKLLAVMKTPKVRIF
jgi:UDP-N-acetyl-D-mannosaminuronic acid dehydrogenase